MMRSVRSLGLAALAVGLAAAASLAGCAALNTGGLPPAVANTIDQAQGYALAACSFLPTVETVAQILAKGSPTLATAAAVGAAICGAVAPPNATGNLSARLRSAVPPSVAGVEIAGQFVKPAG